MLASLLAALIEWSSGWTYVMFGGLVLAIILGTWAGAVAARKGRSMQWWFIIGFFIPLFGLIAAYVVPRKTGEASDGSKS
jgi:hypothetical protein